MNKQLPMLVKQSIASFAYDVAKESFGNVELVIEGFKINTVLKQHRLFLRFNNLKITEYSGQTDIKTQLNILIHTFKGDDKYTHEDNIGLSLLILPKGLTLYNENGSVLGCLNRTDEIEITNFGDTEDGTITQSTAEAGFEGSLNG